MTITRELRSAPQSEIVQKFSRLVGIVSVAFAVVGGLLTIVMALHVAADVASRNLLNSPIPGTIEYITYWWMPMIVFLSVPYVEQKRAHITVTLMTDPLHGVSKERSAMIVKIGSILILIFVLYLAVLSFSDSFNVGQTASGGVPIPIWVGKGVMVLGLIQVLLQMIANSAVPKKTCDPKQQEAPATRGTTDDN